MYMNYNGYCMEFSNDELREYLISKIKETKKDKTDIRLLSEDGDVLEDNTQELIDTIVFDGDKEELFITFFGIHTSIFIFDQEIMFIDEASTNTYTSSDVYNNIVYEGKLREMSHSEMLEMFSKIILCFFDATDIEVKTDTNNPTEHRYFSSYKYILNVVNNHVERNQLQIGNIVINY